MPNQIETRPKARASSQILGQGQPTVEKKLLKIHAHAPSCGSALGLSVTELRNTFGNVIGIRHFNR